MGKLRGVVAGLGMQVTVLLAYFGILSMILCLQLMAFSLLLFKFP